MNNPLGELKVALGQQLTVKDCKDLATLAGLPPAVIDKIKDGLSLMSTLEQRGKFTKDDVSYLVDIFTQCELGRAASIARDYQTESVQKRPDNPLGVMKIAVASQLTYTDCQTVATMANFPPAKREQMKDGVTLMNALEGMGCYKEHDVKELLVLLTKCDLHKAATIVEEYHQKNHSANGVNGSNAATPDHPCIPVQPDDPTVSPNFALSHMEDEIPECKLAQVAEVMGQRAKIFAVAHLTLTTVEVQSCEYNTNTLADRNFNYLMAWKSKVGEEATYKKLCENLHKFKFSKEVWSVLEIVD
ncbi:hypothetical protein HOLleu_25071 [Holothuria leucospilota]|uniref:Death domain-containing protein n=1 Tax=Holothuria leucospilota TaxID=206669 RepID=A0A9Q1BS65_HOLLE|nr:hypothetical protein HOLleu_25071 [Holothuria leucospilota]